jgi:hypothetical protein
MTVDCSRLDSLLATHGFEACGNATFVPSCRFVRSDQSPDLYQHIDVGFAGPRSEVVIAYIAISATKWIRLKGTSESRLLIEIAGNQERGWTPIVSTTDARAWEQTLAQMAPMKVTELAEQHRTSLVRRTDEAREQARRNLTAFNANRPITTQVENLKIAMPGPLAAEAERLTDCAGVVQRPGAREHYLLAALLLFNQDGSNKFIQQNPLLDNQLMWIVQLTADAILSASGGKSA